jgi:hypothetical protein
MKIQRHFPVALQQEKLLSGLTKLSMIFGRLDPSGLMHLTMVIQESF